MIGLDRETNKRFQDFAILVAKKGKSCRVHSDVKYWRRDFVGGNKIFQSETL